MPKSFRERLEALEALEAEQERLRVNLAGAATVDDLSDDAVLWEAAQGLRGSLLHVIPGGFLPSYSYNEIANAYWRAVADRAQAILDVSSGVFIALDDTEARDAIAAIDAGHVAVRTTIRYGPGAATYARCYHLVDECPSNPDKHGHYDTLRAVVVAVWAWASQLGYPMAGSWELTTPAEWRAWLVEHAAPVVA